ncbi:3D domain-containing protein [Intestinibacillus massiliensis]|uniref:3D domain-containing protein n=1 Tax=Intestinibacillus massiliensis TaxID=1871029 RepID=UPI000B34AED4|nr:3D domain-containing protein [Intestinibacillus massiliensis]MCB6365204.1 3D domain-containing protein [Intestinibacillus massiliensis]
MFFHSKKIARCAAAVAIALCMGIVPAAYAYDAGQAAVAVIAPTTGGSAQGVARSADQMEAAQAAEAAKAAQAAEEARLASLVYRPVYGAAVQYSTAKTAGEVIKANGSYAGNFKLTFYCPCSQCSGPWGGGTSSGKRAAEGRTIAVDPKKIPIGSRVYIEGFGDFIAEDVGGAIKGNKIDIFVNSHSRCYDLGVKYANVYVMN